MDQLEQRDLPGNDASWFREMLADQNGQPDRLAAAAITEELPRDDTATGVIATEESSATDAAVATEDPDVAAPISILPDSDDVAEIPAAEPHAGAVEEPDVEPAEPPEAEAIEVVADAEDTAPELATEPEDLAEAETKDPVSESSPAHEPEIDPDDSSVMAAVPALDEAPLENTSEMVGQLWTARDSAGPLEDWEPDEMDRKVRSRRPFRWTTLVGVLAVIALIVVGLVLLPSISRNRADNHREMLTSALRGLRSELPSTQTSLAIATEPESDVAAINDLTTQLTVLAAKASALDEAAQADLPAAPPLTSRAPIDELEPIRQRAEPLGTVALTIQRRIANVVEYRTLMTGFLELPELPTTADSATQADLRVVLAAAQADSAAILAELPNDVSLEAHRAQARQISERFATWQVDYLEALRTEDSATARTLVAELTADITSLDAELVTPLAQIRRQADADLIDLARSIDDVVRLADGLEATA